MSCKHTITVETNGFEVCTKCGTCLSKIFKTEDEMKYNENGFKPKDNFKVGADTTIRRICGLYNIKMGDNEIDILIRVGKSAKEKYGRIPWKQIIFVLYVSNYKSLIGKKTLTKNKDVIEYSIKEFMSIYTNNKKFVPKLIKVGTGNQFDNDNKHEVASRRPVKKYKKKNTLDYLIMKESRKRFKKVYKQRKKSGINIRDALFRIFYLKNFNDIENYVYDTYVANSKKRMDEIAFFKKKTGSRGEIYNKYRYY